jgi:uncharacterized protein YuzE
MNVHYDATTDTLKVVLGSGPVAESRDDLPGVIFDLDREGNLVSLEILDASKRVQDPRTVTVALSG